MAELISPTVDLLIYDLRHELGQTLEEIQENRDHFSQKLPANFASLLWEKDHQYDAEFIELLGEKTQIANLPLSSKEYQGYFYPVRMQDVYGLLLSCGAKDKYVPYPVSCLSEIKTLLESVIDKQPGTLGQTWIVSAHFDSLTNKNSTSLARECYQTLLGNVSWEENLTNTSSFLGGTLFELWHYDSSIPEDLEESSWESLVAAKLAKNHHVLIAIYRDRDMASSANYFLTEWMRLFCYRHKILWHHSQCRLFKQLLETDLMEIQQYIDKSNKETHRVSSILQLEEQLDKLREIFSDYSIDLNYFQSKLAAMEINLHHYCQQMNLMVESFSAENLPGELTSIEQFVDLVKDKYLWFLQKDREMLSGGLKLLEGAIHLLRAEVEVSQAKRDRAFQNTALTVGTGLGCGIVTAAIASRGPVFEQKQIETALANPVGKFMSENLSIPQMWVVPSLSATLSLTVALIAAGVMGTILALGERK
jgi:hypothetical protein